MLGWVTCYLAHSVSGEAYHPWKLNLGLFLFHELLLLLGDCSSPNNCSKRSDHRAGCLCS